MGLDNGIVVKNLDRNNIPNFIKLPFGWDLEKDHIEIAYWRKCWGIRNDILDILHGSFKGESYADI
jgi:hypothetical protein